MTPRADLLLVTVTDSETDAVHKVLGPQNKEAFPDIFIGKKTYRDLGVIGGARTMLVRAEMGAGGVGGTQETVAAGIAALTPHAVIMLGIAFGLRPDQQAIGDVLVSSQLILYSSQRVGVDGAGRTVRLGRGDRPHASQWLLDRFQAGRDSWSEAPVHVGMLLSGDTLVDNQRFRKQLQRLAPEAIGGEMEGGGLYVAAHARKVDWIVVKAIADWGDGQKHVDKSARQQLAAHNAAAFVLHVLGRGGMLLDCQPAQTPPPGEAALADQGRLRKTLVERLSFNEIQNLCFDVGIDSEELKGSTKSEKVRELLDHLAHRSATAHLRTWIQSNRPDIHLEG